jgi:hypothetical protein
MKEDRKPALEETVAAIADELRPPAMERKVVEAAVREQIALLQALVPQFFSRNAIRRNKDDARGIIKATAKLEKLITMASPELKMRLKLDLAPEPPGPERRLPRRRGMAALFLQLRSLRKICEAAVKNQPGTDEIKRLCVETASNLAWSSAMGAVNSGLVKSFRNYPIRTVAGTIASLLYEVVAPERASDWRRKRQNRHSGEDSGLRRLCDDAHKARLTILSPKNF